MTDQNEAAALEVAASPAPLASTVAAPGVAENDGPHCDICRAILKMVNHFGGEESILASLLDEWGGYVHPAVDYAISVMQSRGKDRWSMQARMEAAPTPVAASGPTLGSYDAAMHSLDAAEKQRQIDAARLPPTSAGPSLVAAAYQECITAIEHYVAADEAKEGLSEFMNGMGAAANLLRQRIPTASLERMEAERDVIEAAIFWVEAWADEELPARNDLIRAVKRLTPQASDAKTEGK